tara:strand:- start:658 stop:1401 length:744 start_codon:yes stop_codon:yes gene_type:complete
MRSPIKNLKNKTNSISKIKELIPKGTVVQTYPFYDGGIEFSLSESDRFVIGTTKSNVVAEFWKYVLIDSKKICLIAEKIFPTLNENTFDLLKKNWFSYKDPYVRSALFFLLNRCSSLGMISHGDLNTDNYNVLSLSELKLFEINNFEILLIDEAESYKSTQHTEINLFNPGSYYFDALNTEQVIGLEESLFKHNDNLKTFANKPSIFIYKFHPRLLKFKGYAKILLDKNGRETNDVSRTKEIILHNV